jgi:hypothetical protein
MSPDSSELSQQAERVARGLGIAPCAAIPARFAAQRVQRPAPAG